MKCTTTGCERHAKKMVQMRPDDHVDPLCGRCLAQALREKRIVRVLGKA